MRDRGRAVESESSHAHPFARLQGIQHFWRTKQFLPLSTLVHRNPKLRLDTKYSSEIRDKAVHFFPLLNSYQRTAHGPLGVHPPVLGIVN